MIHSQREAIVMITFWSLQTSYSCLQVRQEIKTRT